MAAGNSVEVVGNVTRDPELRFTKNGAALVTFGLAHNRRWTNQQTGAEEEAVSFFDVTVWKEQAENCAKSIVKGDRVIVIGRLEQDSWDDKDTGEKRSKLKIVADEVGPSLRWATATVEKNERNASGGGNSGGTRRPRASEQQAPAYAPDEEPF